MWFGNLTSQAETGFVVSGHNKSIIENVVIKETELELKKLSKIPGFFLDFRPSRDGLMNASSIPAIFLEYASHVELQGFQVSIGGALADPNPPRSLSFFCPFRTLSLPYAKPRPQWRSEMAHWQNYVEGFSSRTQTRPVVVRSIRNR